VTPMILCSTGIVTRGPDQTDHTTILEHVSKLGAAGYELVLYQAWYGHLDEVIEDLRTSNLSFPAVHADKLIGAGLGSEDADEADEALATLELNCRAAAALGAEMLVLHLWELPTGDQTIERNLDRLPACLDMAEAYNVVLAVETIPGTVGTPLANLKLAVRLRHGVRIHHELFGELAHAGQLVTGAKGADLDGVPQLLDELQVERHAGPWIDAKDHVTVLLL
jgi:sugar phosphate isomerase/epimerase